MDVGGFPSVNIPVSNNWNYVQLGVIKFNFTWTFVNMRTMVDDEEDEITSPMLSYGPNGELKCTLRVNLGGQDSDYNYYYSLLLTLVSSDQNELEAKYNFSILNANGEKINTKYSKGIRVFRPGQSQGCSKFIQSDLIKKNPNNFLVDRNNLRILCEVTVYKGVQFIGPYWSLSDDLGALFENGEFSDVTLSVNGYEYKVHKAILGARCPVFAAMFKLQTERRHNGPLIISDVDTDVMKEVLRFIYTGRAFSLDTMAEDLLVAANRYQLDNLKIVCQLELCKSLSVANAPKMLALADLYNADQLKSHTIDFITAHAIDVMETEAFRTMFNTHPHLISAAFRSLVTRPKMPKS